MNATDIDPIRLRALHADERSVLTIARELGCSRPTVVKALLALGLVPRDSSAANAIRMAREGVGGRSRLTAAAHAAVRGTKRADADLERRAAGKALRPKLSAVERIFLAAFHRVGLRPVPQYAVGKFNVDFAFPAQRVAVEVDPGRWHSTPRKVAQDTAKRAHLEAVGWTIARWSGSAIRTSNPGLRAVADEFVAGFKLPGEYPPT